MDASRFTSEKTGRLVQILAPKADWAFIPDPLPPKWTFPEDLWPLLAKAKEELARLDGIGRTLPNPNLLLRPLQSREAMRSSRLEGTYATPQELLLFELHPREPRSEVDPANSWLEVSNYGKALRLGMAKLTELPFCLRLIRDLHETLLTGVRGRERTPGLFRTVQVQLDSDKRFIPPPPKELDECLNNFEAQLNLEEYQVDPLVMCFILHYQFEAIHPFRDGNGRVGRVLLALMICKLCKLKMPWLYISAYYEKHRGEYISSLFKISTEGAWRDWIEFSLRGTIEQALDSIERCEKLRSLRDQFQISCRNAGARAHPIIESLFVTPVLTIPDLKRDFGITYPTAKSDVMKLVSLGILAELPDTHPTTYYAPAVFNAAYGEE